MQTMFDLTGRVAIVSGSASGMGRAMALALAEAGADLLLADRNADGLRQTVEAIAGLGRRAVAAVCDMSDPTQVRELFAQVDHDFGRLDVLGNVAGDGLIARPEDVTLEQVAQVLQNLVVGRFCACQEAGRRMLAAGRGSIINICSIAGVTALGRGNFPYSMAMGAVAQMTRELSTEWSGRGVRVNAILPAQVLNAGLAQRMQADPNLEAGFFAASPPDDWASPTTFAAWPCSWPPTLQAGSPAR